MRACATNRRWVGWYPDPVLCVAVGAATYLPFECRFNFPWGWSLHVWI